MNWKFWTWGAEARQLRESRRMMAEALLELAEEQEAERAKQAENSGPSTPLPREVLRFRFELTEMEEAAIRRAFAVPGTVMEEQPQFYAVALIIEQLFKASNLAMTLDALEPHSASTAVTQAAYQRALGDLLGQLRQRWEAERKGKG